MSKFEKLEKKLRALPTSATKEDVLKVLRHYGFEIDKKPGSHIVVNHEKLIGEDGFYEDGIFTIPVKNGRRVIKHYIKVMFKAIDLIKEG